MTIEGLLGRKVGMTTLYWEDGRSDGVTLVEVGPCVVTQIRTAARDGYEAVQVGFQNAKHINKPSAGHLARSGGRFRHLQEFSVDELSEYEVGQSMGAGVFQAGDIVSVQGVSKGRGFAGGVRRHGFAGGPKTHGQSDRHRAPGSIGAGSSPGRVWKGTRMAGHMGARTVTNVGLKIALVDEDRNIIALTGSVPGAKNGIIRIELKRRTDAETRPVLFGVLPLEDETPEPIVEAATVEDVVDDIAEVSTDDADATTSAVEETTDDAVEASAEVEAEAEESSDTEESEEKETTS
ncbi:MAG: 50S ribosomal protein L3 [Chloroflexi bacterium]|nr:50S ribosomal protein L3 [Chloroflexota bacterium]